MLYAHMGILELERLEHPFKELEAVHDAQNMAKAFNKHELLWQDEQRLRAAIFAGPSRNRVREIMEAVERARYVKRIDGD